MKEKTNQLSKKKNLNAVFNSNAGKCIQLRNRMFNESNATIWRGRSRQHRRCCCSWWWRRHCKPILPFTITSAITITKEIKNLMIYLILVIRKLTVLEILFLINVMVKAMTAAVTFHPHLHHIPKKKSDQIGWQFDWSSRGWLNWTQMRNIKEYLVRERDREERDACEIRVKEEGVIVMCCWFLFFSVTIAVFQGERNRFS